MVQALSISENIHTILRVLYDDMMVLCYPMAKVATAIAGIGALIYIAYRIHLSDITAESEETIRQNIVNLAFRADEMDNMMVERFGCEFSEYSKSEA